jgi:hypothetical protein
MILHAIIGHSLVTLANAMLCNDWKQIILYSASKKNARGIVSRVKKIVPNGKKMVQPKIVEIPALDSQKSMPEMLTGLGQILSTLPKADSNHVILYTATVPHLIHTVKILGIQSALVVEDGQLRIKGLHNQTWDMMELGVDQFLSLHGLTISSKINKSLAHMNMDVRGKIHFHWKTPLTSSAKKRLARDIFELRKILGSHTMIHHIDDELIIKWLKNSKLPLDLEGEEE